MPAYCTVQSARSCCRPTVSGMLLDQQCQHVLRLPTVPPALTVPQIVLSGTSFCLLDSRRLQLIRYHQLCLASHVTMHVNRYEMMMQLHAKRLPLVASMVTIACQRAPLQSLYFAPMTVSPLCQCGRSAKPTAPHRRKGDVKARAWPADVFAPCREGHVSPRQQLDCIGARHAAGLMQPHSHPRLRSGSPVSVTCSAPSSKIFPPLTTGRWPE